MRFADGARRLREKLTVDGLRRYTTLFLQHAGEVPAADMTERAKRLLYAEGLPPRYAETALREDAAANPVSLYDLTQIILAKATFKAYAGGPPSSTGGSARGADGDAMQIDSISLAAMQFGVSREVAASYIAPAEGWAPHDTDSVPGSGAGMSAQAASEDAIVHKLLAAMGSRFGNSGYTAGSSSSASSSSGSSRRSVPFDVKKNIPEALAKERVTAGLCVKCGVVKYEPGGRGHNSRTCKAAPDKTTSAADGKRAAGF
jgi:hypothetical protein